jgi:hypothetical protein
VTGPNVRIELDRHCSTGFVEIDGQRLNVRSLRFSAAVGGTCYLTLELRPQCVDLELNGPEIALEEGTKAWLERQGWTPPGGREF